MNLNRTIPFAAVTFVIAGMASMGLPGFSGFVAELMILVGAWHAFPVLAIGVGFGILIGVVYVWRAMQKAFFADISGTKEETSISPISFPERLGAGILVVTSVAIGIYPQIILRIIAPALNSPMFDGIRNGGWR